MLGRPLLAAPLASLPAVLLVLGLPGVAATPLSVLPSFVVLFATFLMAPVSLTHGLSLLVEAFAPGPVGR